MVKRSAKFVINDEQVCGSLLNIKADKITRAKCPNSKTHEYVLDTYGDSVQEVKVYMTCTPRPSHRMSAVGRQAGSQLCEIGEP